MSAQDCPTEKKINVTLVRSPSGNNKQIKDTLIALGLTWLGRTRKHNANLCVLGMVKKVSHLVKVAVV